MSTVFSFKRFLGFSQTGAFLPKRRPVLVRPSYIRECFFGDFLFLALPFGTFFFNFSRLLKQIQVYK